VNLGFLIGGGFRNVGKNLLATFFYNSGGGGKRMSIPSVGLGKKGGGGGCYWVVGGGVGVGGGRGGGGGGPRGGGGGWVGVGGLGVDLRKRGVTGLVAGGGVRGCFVLFTRDEMFT